MRDWNLSGRGGVYQLGASGSKRTRRPDMQPSPPGVSVGRGGGRPRRSGAPTSTGPYTARLVSQRPFGCLFEIVETLVLTLVIFLVIQNFVAQPYRVQQQSMEHTLEPDQYVLVDKLTSHFDDYKRGDIVVFNPPEAWAQGDGTPFIKRVIGVGGDTVDIKDDQVYVNGVALDEPYIYDAAANGHDRRPVDVGDPAGRAVRDGRPSRQLGGFARLRSHREEGRHRTRVAPLLAVQHVRHPADADAPGAPDRRSVSPPYPAGRELDRPARAAPAS